MEHVDAPLKTPLDRETSVVERIPSQQLASDPKAHRLKRRFRATLPNFTDSRRDECLLPARAIKRSLDICEDGAI